MATSPKRRSGAQARTARERQNDGGGRSRCSRTPPRALVPATSTSAVAETNAAADAAPNRPPPPQQPQASTTKDRTEDCRTWPPSRPICHHRSKPGEHPSPSHHQGCYHGGKPDGEGGERAHEKEAPPPPSSLPGGPPPASSGGDEGREMRSERVGGGVAGAAPCGGL
jgi:hypothetical protein